MDTRRQILKKLGVAAVAVAATGGLNPREAAATSASRSVPEALADEGRAPWELIAPLSAGVVLHAGWAIHELEPVRQGAAVLSLRRGGDAARLHLCRRDGVRHGVAASEHVDVLLMNDGGGASDTDEELGRIILGIAQLIAANEQRVSDLEGLQTHAERVVRYAEGGALL